ncbi:hypothetical protein DFH11DRAFT_1623659 [Phellopilus nigrolimitatus]|nr:hypothetical protein DFH11DRAFT_1623659 [Phellopilus nigrolimitatus]
MSNPTPENRVPECLRPPKAGSIGLRDADAAMDMLPLTKLPYGLLPKRNRYYQPPKMYLGYIVTNDWVNSVAKEHNLVALAMSDEGDLCEVRLQTRENVFKFIAKEAGITSFVPAMSAIYRFPGMTPDTWLLTLMSSYDDRPVGNPTNSDIHKIQLYLKKAEPPKWYLSALHWKWGVRPYRGKRW